jgi:hypothetical protein
VSLSSGDEVPHIFTRNSRLRSGEFLITSAKRLFQRHRSKAPIASLARPSADIRSSPKPDADDPGIPSVRGRRAYCGFAGSPATTREPVARDQPRRQILRHRSSPAWIAAAPRHVRGFGSRALARNVPIISLAVASSLTLQCETISGATKV